VYGHNNIQEVQASQISYVENYKKVVSISLTIYMYFLDQYIHVTHSILPFRLRGGK